MGKVVVDDVVGEVVGDDVVGEIVGDAVEGAREYVGEEEVGSFDGL